MSELLLEIRCEEIPARMLAPGMRELATRLFEEVMERGVGPDEVETGFTPRRLCVVMKGLPERQPESEELVTGPPVSVAFDDDGEPTAAFHGFAERAGVDPDELERVETEKGEYLAARQRVGGAPTSELLAGIVPDVVRGVGWAKTMRWGDGEGPWVRPVHGVVALLGGETLPIELFGVGSGAETVGHPISSPEPFAVADADDYRRQLAERGIEISFDERRRQLDEEMRRRAGELGGVLVDDDELLDELAAICEVAGLVQGRFDERFLRLPRPVLRASLRDHQSAFTVADAPDGDEQLPFFFTVMDRADDPRGKVRAGNEWVVEARLADAEFFYETDRQESMDERAARLEDLSFHERLGSYADKSERLRELVGFVCDELGWEEERADGREAARLLKADLVSEMVKEFTSLQGVVGGIYAREEGYSEPVWRGIAEQYLPVSADDPIPSGRIGKACALADRIDTVVGIFGLELVPSGSKDPFGLRRAVQGVFRILLDGELELDVELVAAHASRLYGDRLTESTDAILAGLRPFFEDRIRYLLARRGYAYDEIEAAMAAGISNLPDLEARASALHELREDPDFIAIVEVAKRIENIVGDADEHELDATRLAEPAERDLHAALLELRDEVSEGVEAHDYDRALAATVSLAETLDRFFVEVLVMSEDEEVRRNRIALLQEIARTLSRVADLTELVVDRSRYQEATA